MSQGFQKGHEGYKGRLTHGYGAAGVGRPRIYQVWANMIQRCSNPNNLDYHRYGGRGITVCARWRSFENFLADVGEVPAGLTFDRRDNDLGYNPDNWRWITQRAQCRNQEKTVMVTIDGVTKPRIEWCEQYGIDYAVVRARVNRNGWDNERAITTPVLKRTQKEKGIIQWL